MELGKYRHFKGGEYEVLMIAKDADDLTELVVYKALYKDGGVWVRPLEEFCQVVDKPEFKYKGPRFQKIND